MLSRSGCITHNGKIIIQVCSSCDKSLSRSSSQSPPKFAIANGLYMGVLPSRFNDTSMTEHVMVNLSQPTKFLTVIRGGKHSALRSHSYFFRADPATPAQLLPRDVIGTGLIAVRMVGSMTPEQKVATSTKYQIRVSCFKHLLAWYSKRNHFYKALGQEPCWDTYCVPTRVVADETTEDDMSTTAHADLLDQSTWRFNAGAPPHTDITMDTMDNDELYETTAIASVTDFVGEDHITAARSVLKRNDVVVYRSTAILSDFDPAFWSYAFCDLFPFGRGGFDEPRKVKISLGKYLRRCLRLSSRRHARHPSFTLVGFDVLARKKAMKAIYIRTRIAPNRIASAGLVSREALVAQVNYQEQRLRAIQSNLPLPCPPPNDTHLNDLEAGISTGMRAFWGSNQERSSARADLFSMQLEFGQPSIFFTISPSTSTAFRIANLGGDLNDAELERVQACLDGSLEMSKAKLGSIATSNPFVCAKYVKYAV